ncbi:MAG: beta-lactamase family protein [Phycisphaerales bacterium]|nr:MAG: beta-lactamase family protein [Phycisphaerales bacterium]
MFSESSLKRSLMALVGLTWSAHSVAGAGEPAGHQTIPNPRFAPVRSLIMRGVGQGYLPSASIAVAKDGKIIWQEAFGWADKERKREATPHTIYALASISKPMTATGLMVLAQQKKVALDDAVQQYIAPAALTAYAGSPSDVTIKHLLNHTSGLPTHYNYFYEDEPHRPPSMEETIRRYGILVHPPGKLSDYSNLGYGILGHIIAKVSGRPFDKAMRELVFQPLGMPHTSVGIPPDSEDLVATKYGPGKKPVPTVYVDTPGAAAVYSCAHDLVRFGMFHLKNHLADQEQILEDELIDTMQRDYDKTAAQFDASEAPYGLGWVFKENDNGYGTVWHAGGMEGAGAMLKLVPSEDIAVVVLLNIYDRQNSWEEAQMLADAVIGVLLPEYEKKSRTQSSSDSSQKAPGREFRGTWTGEIKTYEGSLPVTLEFQRDGDVHLSLAAQWDCTWGFLEHPTHHLLLNGTRIERNRFVGFADFSLPSADAKRYPHHTWFQLVREGNTLRGCATVFARTPRMYWGLSSYAKLTKVP